MLSATTAAKYIKDKIKAIELPSTLSDGTHPTFLIRKMPVKTVVKAFNLLKIGFEFDLEEQMTAKKIMESVKSSLRKLSPEELFNIVSEVVTDCVVQPTITNSPSKPGELSIDDISFEDLFFLFDQIWEFSGITEKAVKERIKFR